MQLTSREKIRLVLEAIITIIIVLLLFFAAFGVMLEVFDNIPDDVLRSTILNFILTNENGAVSILGPGLVIMVVLFTAAVVYWRLRRRRRQYELDHIIDALYHIANGNFSERVEGVYSSDLMPVVASVNLLVDNTVNAMEDERKIEQSKDDLITNVSHDIRTPLTSIIGYLGLITSKSYQSEEQAAEYVQIAYEKSKQMKSLVDDLFEYTKVNNPNATLNITTFDILELLDQISAEFALEADKADMTIDIVSEEEHLFIKADAEELVRVFTNLITNALKYSETGDKIIIKIEKDLPQVNVYVSNNGKMIPNKALQQLFDRFYRVESSRTQEKPGSGLGLAIVKNIVDSHGGSVFAESKKGWTTFKVSLPLRTFSEGE